MGNFLQRTDVRFEREDPDRDVSKNFFTVPLEKWESYMHANCRLDSLIVCTPKRVPLHSNPAKVGLAPLSLAPLP